ncbi:MAG: ATP synthase F1 subunit delta, partial [Pseudomonadota bacterium]
DIISAFEMDDAQRDALASAISQRLGREVDVTVSVDSALIGGVIIRAGDLVIDASMRGRLAQLGTALGAAA